MNSIALMGSVLAVSMVTIACAPVVHRASSIEISSILGATEFVVGENRFSFILVDQDLEPLEDALVSVTFRLLNRPNQINPHSASVLDDGANFFRYPEEADFRTLEGVVPHIHDDGQLHEHLEIRSFYVLDKVVFRDSGTWVAEFELGTPIENGVGIGDLMFPVLDNPLALGIGEKVPNAGSMAPNPDNVQGIDSRISPDMFRGVSIDDALIEGKPFIVLWSSPLFCTSSICGPVTDEVFSLQYLYKDMINFVHIDPWDLIAARNDGVLIGTQYFLEWGLSNEPWVYLIGSDHRVLWRFQGLVTRSEIKETITNVLGY